MEGIPRSLITHNEADAVAHAPVKDVFRKPESHQDILRSEQYAALLKTEIPKSADEIQIINRANTALDRRAKKYVHETFSIQESNVHKVSGAEIEKILGEGVVAFYAVTSHEVFYSGNTTREKFVHFMNHEIAHAKQYNNFQVSEGVSKNIAPYQNGVSFVSKDGEYIYLQIFNEGITETLAIEETSESNKNTAVEKEHEEIMLRYNTQLATAAKPLYDPVEFLTLEKEDDGEKPRDFSYKTPRGFFKILIDGVYEKNKDTFASSDDAKEIFYEAYFTGDSSNMSTYIDTTYGAGTFETIKKLDKRKLTDKTDSTKKGLTLQAYIYGLEQGRS